MDERSHQMLKSKLRGAVPEVILPDFPDDDNTVTTTVTKSRRVSFGSNFVKEFIVGSAVSAQCLSEYEQACLSSDSSNANSSQSAVESGILNQDTYILEESLKARQAMPPGSMPESEPENRPKRPKFSSTICFSADSPTADMEFTGGCINLAKSILDKKNKEMRVIIQAKPKDAKEKVNKEDETKYFDGSQFDMSLTKCFKSKENKREEKKFENEKTRIFREIDDEMSFTKCEKVFRGRQSKICSDDESDTSLEDSCKENQIPLDMIMRHLDKDNTDFEKHLFNPEKSLTDVLGGNADISVDSEKLNLNESMDISRDFHVNVLKTSHSVLTEVKENEIVGKLKRLSSADEFDKQLFKNFDEVISPKKNSLIGTVLGERDEDSFLASLGTGINAELQKEVQEEVEMEMTFIKSRGVNLDITLEREVEVDVKENALGPGLEEQTEDLCLKSRKVFEDLPKDQKMQNVEDEAKELDLNWSKIGKENLISDSQISSTNETPKCLVGKGQEISLEKEEESFVQSGESQKEDEMEMTNVNQRERDITTEGKGLTFCLEASLVRNQKEICTGNEEAEESCIKTPKESGTEGNVTSHEEQMASRCSESRDQTATDEQKMKGIDDEVDNVDMSLTKVRKNKFNLFLEETNLNEKSKMLEISTEERGKLIQTEETTNQVEQMDERVGGRLEDSAMESEKEVVEGEMWKSSREVKIQEESEEKQLECGNADDPSSNGLENEGGNMDMSMTKVRTKNFISITEESSLSEKTRSLKVEGSSQKESSMQAEEALESMDEVEQRKEKSVKESSEESKFVSPPEEQEARRGEEEGTKSNAEVPMEVEEDGLNVQSERGKVSEMEMEEGVRNVGVESGETDMSLTKVRKDRFSSLSEATNLDGTPERWRNAEEVNLQKENDGLMVSTEAMEISRMSEGKQRNVQESVSLQTSELVQVLAGNKEEEFLTFTKEKCVEEMELTIPAESLNLLSEKAEIDSKVSEILANSNPMQDEEMEKYFEKDPELEMDSFLQTEDVEMISDFEDLQESFADNEMGKSPGKNWAEEVVQEDRELPVVDAKVIECLKEQSKETGCLWTLNGLRYPRNEKIGMLSFNFELLESSTTITFMLKISEEEEDDSWDSCSAVSSIEIHSGEDNQLRIPEYKQTVDFGFEKQKKFFDEEKKVKTIRRVPYFLDLMNSFTIKLNGYLRQVYSILKLYPGSRLKGSTLSFRLFSFPLFFSCTVFIDLSDLFRLSSCSLSFENDFGSLNEKRIRDLFEECLKGENSLCEFIIKSTKYLIDLEKESGYVSKRNHIRLLAEDLEL